MRWMARTIYGLMPFRDLLDPMLVYLAMGILKFCKCANVAIVPPDSIEPITMVCYFLLAVWYGQSQNNLPHL